ncbi:MAG: type I restriction enzyme HsdR N-terminal domain-containing protein [Paludibacteraceae bacterium]
MNRLNVRDINGRECVFCDWRRRWVRLTPEEWVRQQFLHRLVDDYQYPAGRIAVEVTIAVGEAKKRCDAVVYTRQMQPVVLIECKADHVALTQRTLDQALTYNRRLSVPYLFLHNGPETIVARLEKDKGFNMEDKRQASARCSAAADGTGSENSETKVTSPSFQESPSSSLPPQYLNYIPQWSQL